MIAGKKKAPTTKALSVTSPAMKLKKKRKKKKKKKYTCNV